MNFLQEYVQHKLGWQSSDIKKAYQALQRGYRAGECVGYANIEQIQAYVFTRFPATYQVCLKLIGKYFNDLQIHSVLDWGCGIGTASLALSEYFENLEYYLVEQDKQAKSYAIQFLTHFFPNNIVHHEEISKNIDLSVFSYSLGEVQNWQKTLDSIWDKTKYLLIIEPGTTVHFKRLMIIRDYMLAKEAKLWGPCCHTKLCPLQDNDWCHFAVNVPRSKEHRMLKGGERGFEQEAYSYLLFAKEPRNIDFGRVVAAPRLHGGHIDLKICTKDGAISTLTVGRSSGNYKTLKKCVWGDSLTHELLYKHLPKQLL
jgi:ribosomal protein RSM22 (predicted rRNA methylase)